MAKKQALPSTRELMQDFVERHEIAFTEMVQFEEVGIVSSSTAVLMINREYSRLDNRALADPTVGLMLNLLHRNFEHVEASIVAFVTGCGSSAEVIARASAESSVNILYMLSGAPNSRLRAYFDHYLTEVETQVRKWRSQLAGLGQDVSEVHEAAIDQRLAANNALRRVVEGILEPTSEPWPRTIERFSKIGDALAYRTIYARMCSEVHGDAEETLRYFVGKSQSDESVFGTMALETVWTTRLYIYYSVYLALRASLAYAEHYSLPSLDDRIREGLSAVDQELVEISRHVGADPVGRLPPLGS
jgi:hypothetical protein